MVRYYALDKLYINFISGNYDKYSLKIKERPPKACG